MNFLNARLAKKIRIAISAHDHHLPTKADDIDMPVLAQNIDKDYHYRYFLIFFFSFVYSVILPSVL